MALQTVQWTASCDIFCSCGAGADIIICVTPSLIAPHVCPESEVETNFPYQTIEATIAEIDRSLCRVCKYTFEYDDTQLVEGETLTNRDIIGVLCRNCLTSYIDDKAGEEVYLRAEEDNTLTLVSQHGCEYNFQAGVGSFSIANTETVDLIYALGTLSADVNISACTNNIITEEIDGLCAVPSLLAITDTASVNLTIVGDPNQSLSGDVQISADPGNIISIHADGIFAADSGAGDDWRILGNTGTIDGTNFIGTTDNVAHDVRVNNVRIRRSEPDPVCGNIIDGDPNAITGTTGGFVGCTISGGGEDTPHGGTPHEIWAGYFSTIGGGAGNKMIPDAEPTGAFEAGFSTISGGWGNILELDVLPWPFVTSGGFQGGCTIGGGYVNIIMCSDYNTIAGGFVNQIDYSNAEVLTYVWGDTICGGITNQIFGTVQDVGDPLPTYLGGNFIGGGYDTNQMVNCIGSGIASGSNNFIEININAAPQHSFPAPNNSNGPWGVDFIGGGIQNWIMCGQRGVIGGGGFNLIYFDDSSSIVGGYLNQIIATTQQPVLNGEDIDFTVTDPENANGVGNVILGGEANIIRDGRCSSILGGAFLQIGANTVGFQSSSTRTMTGIDGGTRNPMSFLNNPYPVAQVDVSAFSNIAYFGDVDVWIANTNSTATKVKFFEPNADLDFSSAHYSSFEAQAQAANIEYVWPAAPGIVGDSLKIQSVVGPVVTLEWAA